jgi:hypothetical protein
MSKVFKTTLLFYDVINKNHRIYTKKCAEDIVKQFGELDHPMLGEFCQKGFLSTLDVSLSNVSHEVKEIHLNEEKKCVEGTIELFDKVPVAQVIDLLLNKIDYKQLTGDISTMLYMNIRYKLSKRIKNEEVAEKKELNFDDLFIFRSRGMGKINPVTNEVEDFKLFSFDIIPKHMDSF